jgi:hypothetical protein
MKKTILKIAVCALFAAPVLSRGQDAATNMVATPPTEIAAPAAKTPAKPKKANTTLVATGKIVNVDTNAMTLTVGKRTFELTSETRITKGEKPAVLGDLVVDEKVGVAYKKAGDKLDAITINAKKAEKSDGEIKNGSGQK